MTEFKKREISRREILVFLGAAPFLGCFQGESGEAGDGAQAEGVVVEMTDDYTFSPVSVTVRAGEEVTWRNTSAWVHTATGDPSMAADPSHVELPEEAEPWHSGDVSPGEEYSKAFEIAGEYRYVCLPHEGQGMLGTIIVETGS